MRISWRHVSALLVLLALAAVACSSDPVDVVSGANPDDEAAVEETVGDADSGTDDAMEDQAPAAVAEDSAPRDVASPGQLELLDALAVARARWLASGIEDYDFTLDTLTDLEPSNVQIEVRGGEVTERVASRNSANANAWSVPELFDQIEEAIVDQLEMTVAYDDRFGFPVRAEVVVDGDESASLMLSSFRTADVYPDTCSTSGLDYPGPDGEDPVSVTWSKLLVAAQSCDYLMLASLADEATEGVTFSFGGGGIELLWEAEARGDLRLGIMAELLSAEPGVTEGGITVWPDEFADPESNYLDWRVGINDKGEWLFFVAGD